MSYKRIDDLAAHLLDEFSIEVPEIVAALADRFIYNGIPASQAARQARDMITLAMEDPEKFDAVFGETYH